VSANIARHLDRMAAERPAAPALKLPRGRTRSGEIDYLTLTFAELAAETEAWCGRLEGAGVCRGDRVLVMVRPGLPLIATAFALFKLGAVPVIIDPGMGLRNFLTCVARSRPRVLVGIPLAQILSQLCRRAFRSVQVRVRVSGSPTARLGSGGAAEAAGQPPAGAVGANPSPVAYPAPREPMAPHDLAAILFTSGSTGAPKGVCYEHGMFEAQVKLIRETYQIEPGEIDLPLLPIFALFNPALGMTSIIRRNSSRPSARRGSRTHSVRPRCGETSPDIAPAKGRGCPVSAACSAPGRRCPPICGPRPASSSRTVGCTVRMGRPRRCRSAPSRSRRSIRAPSAERASGVR
jgi:acyl-CoA synthetase (AMP-forming)/AMP-acid ligase II